MGGGNRGRQKNRQFVVGLQYILDKEEKTDEGFAQIGYCKLTTTHNGRKEVQIPHDKNNTGHEVPANPNRLRHKIWCIQSIA